MQIIDADYIILHCSATPAGQDVSVETIRRWHVVGNGWTDIGYHFIIGIDGTLHRGRSLERPGAHTKGWNTNIGVCYVGGLNKQRRPKDTMTPEQEATLRALVAHLRAVYGTPLPLRGHNDFTDKKACPSFKVQTKFPELYG